MLTKRECPVCRAKNAGLLYTIKYPAEKDRILPTEYRIVECTKCGMVYDDFDADESVFAEHYKRDGKYEMQETNGAGGAGKSDLSRWNTIYSFLFPFLTDKNVSIADIGAGKGGLSQFLWEKGYRNLTAVDASPSCVDFMQKNFPFSAVCSDFQSFHFPCGFGVVILAQTLEHLFCCRKSLEKVREITEDGGILYLEVPDASRYLEYKKLPFYYFDHEHINHFQEASLKNLLEACGFEVLFFSAFVITAASGFTTPHIAAIARKKQKQTKASLYKNESLPIQKYVAASIADDEKLSGLKQDKRFGYLWGVGALCQRLLEKGTFDKMNIAGLIDLDQKKQGTSVHGLTVFPPDILLKTDQKNSFVMITTALYENQIRAQLADMGYRGEIMTLK